MFFVMYAGMGSESKIRAPYPNSRPVFVQTQRSYSEATTAHDALAIALRGCYLKWTATMLHLAAYILSRH